MNLTGCFRTSFLNEFQPKHLAPGVLLFRQLNMTIALPQSQYLRQIDVQNGSI